MYQDIFVSRSLELQRILEDEADSNNAVYRFQRSNAIRRRRINRKISTVKRAQMARREFEKCIERCGILGDEDTANKKLLSGYLKWLRNIWRKQKNINRYLKDASSEDNSKQPLLWLLKWRSPKVGPICDNRIQQVDGAFFERFGSLFREQAEGAAAKDDEERQRVAVAAAETAAAVKEEEEEDEEEEEEEEDGAAGVCAAGEEEEGAGAPGSSDSETEQGDNGREEITALALNIDKLYQEVLYEILHNVGCDVHYEIGQIALISYAQEAFKIPHDKHRLLLEEAERKEPPEFLINVEVIEAKDLKPMDSNGLSDPFVTLYLVSNSSHRCNTSVKSMTLNPVWEEHFALQLGQHFCDDILCLEVWDFDPAESMKETFGKFFDVKGVKGIRKLVKEIAVTARNGQHVNELIGFAKIPLNTIPASGMTMWYSIDKKNKVNRQGGLRVRLTFSSEKNRQAAQQEHRYILRTILLHELETSKVAPYWWCGNYSPQGEQLLIQHIAQSGLSQLEVAMCQYVAYAGVHQNHALNFALFSNLLDKLIKSLQLGNIEEEDVKLFWDATKKLLPSCFSIIRKIRKKTCTEKTTLKQVTEVLKLLNKLCTLKPLENVDLFPSNLYPWISYNSDGPNSDIISTINDAVVQGATDWLNHNLENIKKQDETDLSKLQYFIEMIQLIKCDVQKAIEFYDKLFQEIVNFKYAKALYIFYQAKISLICEPEVVEICKSLKILNYNKYRDFSCVMETSDPLNEGTELFELYLTVQRFVALGERLYPTEGDTFQIKNFHRWFYGGVAQWLDIAAYKASQRIMKAVELDKLIAEVPVNNMAKYSSSAVDTLTIFYQVKVFWQQLNWPDVEGCYTFIAKIIDDICRCCTFYAKRMSERLEGMGDTENVYDKTFKVTSEWCLAINNIDYIRESLEPFTNDLGMDQVIEKLSDLKSPLEAQRCQHTLNNVIANAIDMVTNEIIELLETVVNKMVPSIKRLLIEGAELYQTDSNSVDRLMMYVDENLSTLHRELNKENFQRTLEITWSVLSDTLTDIIKSNQEKRRPRSFFDNLRQTLNLMLGSFKKTEDSVDNCDSLKNIEKILRINALETADIIHEVHLEFAKKYSKAQDTQFGELSVRAKFEDDNLIIEIINGRNLMAMDSNGSCDAFVRINLIPEHKFSGVNNPKTKCHYKNQFPLFDEKFTINLSSEQRSMQDGLLLFSCKDKDMLGYNRYIGQAYMHFSEIPSRPEPVGALPQVHLHLTRPTPADLNMESVKTLRYRQGDKLAKEFLKKYRQRMG